MYKKITHTIVEEHFDHPIATQIKKSIHRSEIPNNEIFAENKFRTDVTDYFTTYLTDLSGIIDSVTGTEEDLVVPFERIFKNEYIDTLGNMTKAIYPSFMGEKINEALRRMTLISFVLSQQLRMGRDPQYMLNTFNNIVVNDLATILSGYNINWPYNTIQTIFTDIGDSILTKMKAKMKKDSSTEKAAGDKLASLFTSFGNAFVDGMIKQHPERFTSAATIVNSKPNHRDIM
jgi:hypothetical protein